MTDEERNKIIRQYNNLKRLKEQITTLKQEIKELEKEPLIMHYLELNERLKKEKDSDFYEVENLSNKEVLEKVINNTWVTNTNNIFVYLGTYQLDLEEDEYCPCECITTFDNPDASYHQYIDIEEEQIIDIDPKLRSNFENNNIVLYPPEGINSRAYFSEIRSMYLGTAIKYGCDKALEKILCRRSI